MDEKNIKNDYMRGLKYKDIEGKYNITHSQLIYLIQKGKWKRKSNRSEVQKGNQNAKGNKGGNGPGQGNKNAVITGEYETIYTNLLTEDEQGIINNFSMDSMEENILSELKILTIREVRILAKIKKYSDGKDLSIMRMTKTTSNITSTTTEAENNINIVHKLEEALTRVQDAKRKYIDSYHKIANDNRKLELELIRLEMEASKEDSSNNEDMKDDSFIQALNDSTEGAWNDYTEE